MNCLCHRALQRKIIQYTLRIGKEWPDNSSLSAPPWTFQIRAAYEMCCVVEPLLGIVPHATNLYCRSSVETRHVECYHDNERYHAGCANRPREARRRSQCHSPLGSPR